jgi:PAS domain S-box-containing protein
MTISVLLVDDHRGVRESLRCLLDKDKSFHVVGEAENGQLAVQMVERLHPDVVVMDVIMPELNGIDATRTIRKRGYDTKVLALSMHSERRHIANMLRAGASGYVLKDHAYSELAQAVRSVAGYATPGQKVMGSTPLLTALDSLQPGDHVCCVHETEEEVRAVVGPYLQQGLEASERVLYIADIRSPQMIAEWLCGCGVDMERRVESGQFKMVRSESAHTQGGTFNPDRMIAYLKEELREALEEGYGALRVASEMSWALSGFEGSERLGEYEAKLDLLLRDAACAVLCLFDRNQFPPEILLEALATHPVVICGTEVCDNFHHVPPEDYLSPASARAELERKLDGLRRRRQTEAGFKRTADMLTHLFDTFPMPVYYKDSEGAYLECNRPFAEQIMGLPKEKILGHTLDELECALPNDLRTFWQDKETQLVSAGGGSQAYETQVPSADGERRPFLMHMQSFTDLQSGEPAIMGLMTDLSEQKRAEAESARLIAAIEHAAEAVVITDTAGTIQYVNPAFTVITGHSRAEAVGANPRILKSGRQDESFYQKMWGELSEGRVWSGRLVNRRKNGTFYDEEMTVSPVPDPDGSPTHFVAIKRDITEQEALTARLRQAQKMEAIGTLAGGIAHDFNNILAGIFGYSELGLEEVDPSTRLHADLRHIHDAARRAKELVYQILAFSRQVEGERHPLRLESVVKECLKLLRPSMPSNIEILVNLAPDCPRVVADATQMHQIIMNLCTNAYHAMREKGGTLTVGLHPFVVSGADMHDRLEMCLTVSDTGRGMPPEILDRIFEPYFTTKAPGEGTGLGLATVHGIVASHNGAVTVCSDPDLGSTFSVYLPAAPADLPEKRAAEEPPVRGGDERILVVDDEEPLAMLQERVLSRLGYKVTAMKSSLDALAAFKASPNDFDLVLTDQTMPGMTGYQLGQQMLAIRPGIPIILTTGYGDSAHRDAVLLNGIGAFMAKPAEIRDMARLVRRLLDQAGDKLADVQPAQT